MAAPDQILARVTTGLVQSLGVEQDDVTPAASLLGDLGAESIDLLDIVFRWEREFAITIPRGELFIEPTSPGQAEYVRDGRMTAEGLAALLARMPYADLSERSATGGSKTSPTCSPSTCSYATSRGSSKAVGIWRRVRRRQHPLDRRLDLHPKRGARPDDKTS